MKVTLLSDNSVRYEAVPGPLTIEAERAEQPYSPFHMLGSSLAVCTYSILSSWASHAGINADSLSIDVSWTFVEKPHRIGSMALTFAWPDLPPQRLEAAKRAALLCPVHATLSHEGPTITIDGTAKA